jgi:hypothetical protein
VNLHLNSEQIDELLQSAMGHKPGATANWEPLADAQRHLRDCPDCQTRMRAQEQVNQQLAFLQLDTPGVKGPMCPPDDVWLELAAGIVRQDSEKHLGHAAQCDYCGPLLRQTKEDFSGELTPEEETVIANLPSSTRDWQERMAVKLQQSQASLPAFSPPKAHSPSFITSLLVPWRLALAGAITGLILLGVRDYRRTINLSAQNVQVTAEVQRLKQSNLQQSTQIAELTTELRKSGTRATVPEPQTIAHPQMAALVLEPGLTRGIGSLKHLTVPRGTDIAKITLRLLDAPGGVIREDLVTADGEIKWKQELRPSEFENRTNSLSLLLPAYILTPNDYQIVLSRQEPGGFERLATYTFRVTR